MNATPAVTVYAGSRQDAPTSLLELATALGRGVAKRGWILVYGGDAFVALPGGFGTLEELSEILVERQLDLHRKPLLLVSPDGFWDPLLTQLERAFAGAAPHPKVAQW